MGQHARAFGSHPRGLHKLLVPSRLRYTACLVTCLGLWLLASHQIIRPFLQGLFGLHSSKHHGDGLSETCKRQLAQYGLLAVQDSFTAERHEVYKRMSAASTLRLGGLITQGLKQADIFSIEDASGEVGTILQALKVPVRAITMPLVDLAVAFQFYDTLQELLLPALPVGTVAFLQDHTIYHSTLVHASSHQHPVPAAHEVVMQEVHAVGNVLRPACPIRAVLERILITSTGVVVAAWQVDPASTHSQQRRQQQQQQQQKLGQDDMNASQAGSEPAMLRSALLAVLPHAPPREAQTVREQSILHMTIARILLKHTVMQPVADAGVSAGDAHAEKEALESAGGKSMDEEKRNPDTLGHSGLRLRRALAGSSSSSSSSSAASLGQPIISTAHLGNASSADGSLTLSASSAAPIFTAVQRMSDRLCGLRADFGMAWFIEETDLLALGLRGKFIKHELPLTCTSHSGV